MGQENQERISYPLKPYPRASTHGIGKSHSHFVMQGGGFVIEQTSAIFGQLGQEHLNLATTMKTSFFFIIHLKSLYGSLNTTSGWEEPIGETPRI